MPQDRPTAQWSVVDIAQEVIPRMKRPDLCRPKCERSERQFSGTKGVRQEPSHDWKGPFRAGQCQVPRDLGTQPALVSETPLPHKPTQGLAPATEHGDLLLPREVAALFSVLHYVGRPNRWTPPGGLVEVTARTIQGRALLRPGPELNRRFLGVVGRAQRRESMRIHGVTALSTHWHGLLSPDEPDQLARFMHYVQTHVAKEAGDLHDWKGPFWARRYRHIPVSAEDDAQVARLRYLLENDGVSNCTSFQDLALGALLDEVGPGPPGRSAGIS